MSQQRNILTGGLRLTLRNWPALAWTYGFNLGLALLFAFPLHRQIDAITSHSLASQRLTGAFDLGALTEVIMKLGKGPGPATLSSYFSTPIYLLVYFLLVPGTLFCYQTGTPAGLFMLLESGFAHFWRFVRITLITLVVCAPILHGLNVLRNLWSAHVDLNTVGRPAFLLDLAGLVLIGLIAAVFRLYFDLVQVYTVQLGLQSHPVFSHRRSAPERQIRRTLKPAWNALRRNFLRACATFIFLTVLGLAAVAFTARVAMHSLAQPRVWPMFLLAQLGLFLMLLTRFWQRGAETILAVDNPLPEPATFVPQPVAPISTLLDSIASGPSIPETLPADPAPRAESEQSAPVIETGRYALLQCAPFRIHPLYVSRIWGFRDLRPWFDHVAEGAPIGEVWLTGDQCRVAGGPHDGKKLGDLFHELPEALLGPGAPSPDSPTLIKVLFAREKLSVQVHPDDKLAQKYGEPRGKTECWYALASEPGAQVACGLKPGVTLERIEAGIRAGTVEQSLNLIDMAAGDMILVDAGTVHAIWPGSILLETQQNCDLTYRLFDYGRPRELQIEKSLEAIRLTTRAGKVPPKDLADRTVLIETQYFRLERLRVQGSRLGKTLSSPAEPENRLSYLFAAAGSGQLAGPDFDPVDLPVRGIVAVPANAPSFVLKDLGGLDLIRIAPNWPKS